MVCEIDEKRNTEMRFVIFCVFLSLLTGKCVGGRHDNPLLDRWQRYPEHAVVVTETDTDGRRVPPTSDAEQVPYEGFSQVLDHTSSDSDRFEQPFWRNLSRQPALNWLYLTNAPDVLPPPVFFDTTVNFYVLRNRVVQFNEGKFKELATHDQVVEDVGTFIRDQDSHLPWIVAGCGANGVLALRAKQRFPQLVQFVMGFSTPLRVTDEYSQFFDFVLDAMNATDSEATEHFREQMTEFRNWTATAEGRREVAHLTDDNSFLRPQSVCAPSLVDPVRVAAEVTVMGRWPAFFRLFAKGNYSLQAFAQTLSAFKPSQKHLQDALNDAYQKCTEMGSFETASSARVLEFFGENEFSHECYNRWCDDVFQRLQIVVPPLRLNENQEKMRQELHDAVEAVPASETFEAVKPSIFLLNSELDPWQSLSVTTSMKEHVRSTSVGGQFGGHCRFSSAHADEWLTSVFLVTGRSP